MPRRPDRLPEVAFFLAGMVVAGMWTKWRHVRALRASGGPDLREAIHALENRLASQESGAASRFGELESRIREQSVKLSEGPTQEVVGAMELLLSKTMASLEDRMAAQAQSLEVLKATVSQTDRLLERVLESLDSLQSDTEASGSAEDTLINREAL